MKIIHVHSSGGKGPVAIDSKIEQAMVSIKYWKYFLNTIT